MASAAQLGVSDILSNDPRANRSSMQSHGVPPDARRRMHDERVATLSVWIAVYQQVKTKDQYGRNVAACSISPDLPFQQPEDMGTFLVSNGYAVAYR